MAKEVILSVGGQLVYPLTITDTIADINTRKKLSDIVLELYTISGGWTLILTNSKKYDLVDYSGTSKGSISLIGGSTKTIIGKESDSIDNETVLLLKGSSVFINQVRDEDNEIVSGYEMAVSLGTLMSGISFINNKLSVNIAPASDSEYGVVMIDNNTIITNSDNKISLATVEQENTESSLEILVNETVTNVISDILTDEYGRVLGYDKKEITILGLSSEEITTTTSYLDNNIIKLIK